ncbi:hypothetical protein GCM10010468_28660 [Actinocorallia longicatena]|uniref:Uncharacterized protein n=1 Tax=Actinocorallia longicatena TaxID=111803 RepID=A0ABP6Q817_9ACTN
MPLVVGSGTVVGTTVGVGIPGPAVGVATVPGPGVIELSAPAGVPWPPPPPQPVTSMQQAASVNTLPRICPIRPVSQRLESNARSLPMVFVCPGLVGVSED